MPANKIVFSNLRAEMARNGVTVQDIGQTLDVNRDTAGRKLSGKSPLTLFDAFRIARKHFPESDIRYLFRELLDLAQNDGGDHEEKG